MKQKEEQKTKSLIISTLNSKSNVKFNVYKNILEAFNMLKGVLAEMSENYNEELKKLKSNFKIEYSDKGEAECEFVYSSDMLIFNASSNIYEFDKSHPVWTDSYVQDNPLNAFCGIISIYNFLSSSYKFNRSEDLGYLLARIFINQEKHYFVEGKRQLGFLYNDFANALISKNDLKNISESAILYSLDFELLVPNYDDVSVVSVEQMKDKISKSKTQTGKRLGFKFYPDDINI